MAQPSEWLPVQDAAIGSNYIIFKKMLWTVIAKKINIRYFSECCTVISGAERSPPLARESAFRCACHRKSSPLRTPAAGVLSGDDFLWQVKLELFHVPGVCELCLKLSIGRLPMVDDLASDAPMDRKELLLLLGGLCLILVPLEVGMPGEGERVAVT